MLKSALFSALVIALGVSSASAQLGTGSNSSNHSRSAYVDRNGRYHAPAWQTNPNSTQRDNYGARGNYNPYTGKVGRRAPKY